MTARASGVGAHRTGCADNIPIGTAKITGTDSRSPDALKLHGFAGLQIHTRHVRIAAQGALQDGAYSVALALRFAL